MAAIKFTKVKYTMALYQNINVTRSTIYMESFLIVSQNAQPFAPRRSTKLAAHKS